MLPQRLLFAALCCAAPNLASSAEQFTISVRTSASTSASAYYDDPVTISNAVRSISEAKGLELLKGDMFSTASSGFATANVSGVRVSKQAAYVTSDLKASTMGGHLRKCLADGAGCLEVLREDTPSMASATTNSLFDIKFDAGARPVVYELSVAFEGRRQNSSVAFDLIAKGEVMSFQSDNDKVLIQGRPGELYTVQAKLIAAGEQSGSCCGWAGELKGAVKVALKRAPIIWSRLQDRARFSTLDPAPRVAGGREVLAGEFQHVGAFLIDGRPHCTGTLIAARKVLTAAHCIYEYDLTKMTFALGVNAWKPDKTSKVVNAWYPKNELGFNYNDKSLEDDIAIVEIKDALPTQNLLLHKGTPALDKLKDDREPLSFVGFGYELVDGSPGGVGKKRMAVIPLSRVSPKTMRYEEAGKNTCNGDSGGPALFIDSSSGKLWLLAGVTSSGDRGCTDYGINTRVDTYLKWIQKH